MPFLSDGAAGALGQQVCKCVCVSVAPGAAGVCMCVCE